MAATKLLIKRLEVAHEPDLTYTQSFLSVRRGTTHPNFRRLILETERRPATCRPRETHLEKLQLSRFVCVSPLHAGS